MMNIISVIVCINHVHMFAIVWSVSQSVEYVCGFHVVHISVVVGRSARALSYWFALKVEFHKVQQFCVSVLHIVATILQYKFSYCSLECFHECVY